MVDLTNLQRQIVHGTSTLGRPKLESAKARLTDLNPNVNVESHETRLTRRERARHHPGVRHRRGRDRQLPDPLPGQRRLRAARQAERLRQHLPLRGTGLGLLRQGRALLPLPLLRAAPSGTGARAAPRAACSACCPGIIGSIQALETIKLILGAGDSLIGRLVLFDALKLRFRELKLRKDPDCPICGDNPTIRELIDYEAFCGIGAAPAYQGPEVVRGAAQAGAGREGRRPRPDRRARAARVGDRPHRGCPPDSAGPAPRPPRRARRPRRDRDLLPQGRRAR